MLLSCERIIATLDRAARQAQIVAGRTSTSSDDSQWCAQVIASIGLLVSEKPQIFISTVREVGSNTVSGVEVAKECSPLRAWANVWLAARLKPHGSATRARAANELETGEDAVGYGGFNLW